MLLLLINGVLFCVGALLHADKKYRLRVDVYRDSGYKRYSSIGYRKYIRLRSASKFTKVTKLTAKSYSLVVMEGKIETWPGIAG